MDDLKDKFCSKPWDFFEIQENEIYNCCPTWVNHKYVGKTTEDLNVEEVWNGEAAKEFRKSILDGSFRYCNKKLCPVIASNSLPTKTDVKNGLLGPMFSTIVEFGLVQADKPNTINLCYDRSCNLKCPSCRKDFIYYTEKTHKRQFDKLTEINKAVLKYVHSEKKKMNLIVTGSGDPFGSRHFYELLKQLDYNKNPKLEVTLQTNGVLFTEKRWEELKNLHKFHINVIVSLDAGTEEAYNLTRVGGNWQNVNENLQFISNLYKENKVKDVRLDMVVQYNNYKTIPQFIDIAKKYNFRCATSRIVNWGTFTPIEFMKHDIFDKRHPRHNDFIQVLKNIEDYDRLEKGNISDFYTE